MKSLVPQFHTMNTWRDTAAIRKQIAEMNDCVEHGESQHMKTCTECGKTKPASEYRLHSDKKTVMRYCNDCHLAKRRKQHAAKREERNAKFRARYAANVNGVRDKIVAARKAKYVWKGRAALIAWAAANPEKAAEAQRKKMKRGRDRLSDYYVRRLLCHPDRSAVKQVPDVLIECKRLQLMIERECRHGT